MLRKQEVREKTVIRKTIKRNADPGKKDLESYREALDTNIPPSLMRKVF